MAIEKFNKLRPIDALNLAAPHTWPASICPVLCACAAAIGCGFGISAIMAILLLLISVSFQSAANCINDYYDFKKGTDNEFDGIEADDSVIVHRRINPRTVMLLAISFIALAFVLGIYVIFQAGMIPLAIAIFGALVVFLYSWGKTPISYLPIGEITSGLVMGALIFIASYYSLTKELSFVLLLWSCPLFIGIALIMLTNNTCDIERDVNARRRTLPVMVGRDGTRAIYKVALILWYLLIIVITMLFFKAGSVFLPFLMLFTIPSFRGLFGSPMDSASRVRSMSMIVNLNIAMGAMYAICMIANLSAIHI